MSDALHWVYFRAVIAVSSTIVSLVSTREGMWEGLPCKQRASSPNPATDTDSSPYLIEHSPAHSHIASEIHQML